MKNNGNRLHKILLAVIGVLAVVLVAVMIRKAYTLRQERVKQEELKVRHEQIQSELEDIEMQIKELSGDGAALQKFLDEKINRAKEEKEKAEKEREAAASGEQKETAEGEAPVSANSVSDNGITDESLTAGVSENSVSDNSVSDNGSAAGVSENSVPGNGQPGGEEQRKGAVSDGSVSDNGSISDNDVVSGNNGITDNDGVSGNDGISDSDSISGNGIPAERISGGSISGNAIVNGEMIPFRYEEQLLSLEERRSRQSSYAETQQINEKDRAAVAARPVDFSNVTIACLGDSLTEGNVGDNGEKYSYPALLKSILNAKEVYNLGIGGSSLGRYWDKAYVDRYKEIPSDADVILVMGGTNDGFCASAAELGSLSERKKRTFYGDVDELMRGLKADYPGAKILFATPLPNVLHDYLMTQRDFLLPQSVFANAVKELAAEYGIDVIDLYNSNLLDTHDSLVIANYMPDGVHGNEEGYRILAEHFAGALIEIFERDALSASTVSGNTVSGNGETAAVSGNGLPSVETPDTAVGGEISPEEAQTDQIKEESRPAEGDAEAPQAQDKQAEAGTKKEASEEETEQEESAGSFSYSGEAIVIR